MRESLTTFIVMCEIVEVLQSDATDQPLFSGSCHETTVCRCFPRQQALPAGQSDGRISAGYGTLAGQSSGASTSACGDAAGGKPECAVSQGDRQRVRPCGARRQIHPAGGGDFRATARHGARDWRRPVRHLSEPARCDGSAARSQAPLRQVAARQAQGVLHFGQGTGQVAVPVGIRPA